MAGAWYGMFEVKDQEKPIVPLGPLLQLPELLWAGRLFVETGSTRALEEVLERHEKMPSRNRENLVKHLRGVAQAHDFGLPLELSHTAGQLATLKKDVRAASQVSPYAQEVLELVQGEARKLSGSPKKGAAPFNAEEKERQHALTERYYNRRQFARFLAVLREWLVSRVVQGSDWLNRDARSAAERSLGRLHVWRQDPHLREMLEPQQLDLAKAWRDISDLRNKVQHQGMSKQNVLDAIGKGLPSVKEHFDRWSERELPPLTIGGGGGHLLVAALGMSPGVLWSALEHTRPDRLVVVCSTETRPSLDQVLERVDLDIQQVIPWEVADPFAGFEEVRKRLREIGGGRASTEAGELELLRALAGADHVSLCLMGGTTLLGFAVQLVHEADGRLGVASRRFALVDERPVEAQRADPYVIGRAVWMDPE